MGALDTGHRHSFKGSYPRDRVLCRFPCVLMLLRLTQHLIEKIALYQQMLRTFHFLFISFLSHLIYNEMNADRQRLNKALSSKYDIEHNRYPEGYQEAPLAYDAVWSVALAFNKTMERLKVKSRSLKDFTYTDKDIADEIYAAMNSTQFLGVSVSALNYHKFTMATPLNFIFMPASNFHD
jgi:hypothetical protein